MYVGILFLDFTPFFLSPLVNAHFPDTAALLKPLLLQFVEDAQESLGLILQPLLDQVAYNALKGDIDDEKRALIAKADCLHAVLKAWSIKFPPMVIIIASNLPRSWWSLFVIPIMFVIFSA